MAPPKTASQLLYLRVCRVTILCYRYTDGLSTCAPANAFDLRTFTQKNGLNKITVPNGNRFFISCPLQYKHRTNCRCKRQIIVFYCHTILLCIKLTAIKKKSLFNPKGTDLLFEVLTASRNGHFLVGIHMQHAAEKKPSEQIIIFFLLKRKPVTNSLLSG